MELGAVVAGALGKLPNRPAAPDGDGIARHDIAKLCRHEACRKNVREKHDLLIRKHMRDLEWPDIGKWDPERFSLTAGIAAQHMGITEQPCGRMPPDLFGLCLVRIGSLAAGVVPTLTEETSAGNRKWNDDAIAYLKFFVVPSDIDDFTHCLVAKHIATFHRWDYAIEYMKVRATNGSAAGSAYARVLRASGGENEDLSINIPPQPQSWTFQAYIHGVPADPFQPVELPGLRNGTAGLAPLLPAAVAEAAPPSTPELVLAAMQASGLTVGSEGGRTTSLPRRKPNGARLLKELQRNQRLWC
jgi:hypothetical protein